MVLWIVPLFCNEPPNKALLAMFVRPIQTTVVNFLNFQGAQLNFLITSGVARVVSLGGKRANEARDERGPVGCHRTSQNW